MNHTVSHCINFLKALYAAILRANQQIQYVINCLTVIRNGVVYNLFATIGQFELYKRIRQTYFFNTALGKSGFSININKFIFNRAAAAV